MTLKIKICGINDTDALQACIDYGADMAGFVFVKKSVRYIDKDKAATLSQIAQDKIKRVGLFADPSDRDLAFITDDMDLDLIQLHGGETPGRVTAIGQMTGLPVIKALPVQKKSDLSSFKCYQKITEYILYDAKIDDRFGGTGQAFDWSYLADFAPPVPWILAGGLDSGNIGRALALAKPDVVDVSGGVERAPGIKDPRRIKEFIETARKSG